MASKARSTGTCGLSPLEFKFDDFKPISVNSDRSGALSLAENSIFSSRAKHGSSTDQALTHHGSPCFNPGHARGHRHQIPLRHRSPTQSYSKSNISSARDRRQQSANSWIGTRRIGTVVSKIKNSEIFLEALCLERKISSDETKRHPRFILSLAAEISGISSRQLNNTRRMGSLNFPTAQHGRFFWFLAAFELR